MKLGIYAGAIIAAVFLATSPAFAQAVAAAADTHYTFHWGDYASQIVLAVGAAGTWLAGAAIGLLPGPAQWAAKTFKLDQVIGKSISAAALDLASKISGKGFTVDVKSELVAKTLTNVEKNAADLAKKYAGTLELKVKARVQEYIDSLGEHSG